MKLRSHQQEMTDIISRIKQGEPIKRIYCSVTPGGGKSLLPVLLSELIPEHASKLCWVVPRKSLQEQGEREFVEWRSKHRIRIADNTPDPSRGHSGYITTYQGIAAAPGLHQNEFAENRYVLFLDEPHHVRTESEWEKALKPMIEQAVFTVYASGTFYRGDSQKIAFLPYKENRLSLESSQNSTIVRYSRAQALSENAVLPVYFKHIDGEAEWIDKEERQQKADTLSEGGDALFTALRTGYAEELLSECLADWESHRKNIYPEAKMLVVAPNIELAKEYGNFLLRKVHCQVPIATSDDSFTAAKNIARFKNLQKPAADILVTVAMAYEGLSVKQATHIACLTHIRSVPWLEQCFARVNRKAEGKSFGVIFGPADKKLLSAIRVIELEQEQFLREKEQSLPENADTEGNGFNKKSISPISSQALGIFNSVDMFSNDPTSYMTPSQIETLLKNNITQRISLFLRDIRPGSRKSWRTIIYKKIKQMVPKQLKEMSSEELELVWGQIIELCPLKADKKIQEEVNI